MTPQERKAIYLEYMKMKIEEGDFHGVADAAMDLREIEVEIRMAPVLVCSEHKYEGRGECPICVQESQL